MASARAPGKLARAQPGMDDAHTGFCRRPQWRRWVERQYRRDSKLQTIRIPELQPLHGFTLNEVVTLLDEQAKPTISATRPWNRRA